MKQTKAHHAAADLIRILAGTGVILIHVTDPFISYPPYAGIGGSSWWILNFINAFYRASVPLFLMLSGYLLLDISQELHFKQFYKRRLARIGIPVVFWISFYFVWLYLLGEGKSFSSIMESILTVNLLHLYFLVIILELYFVTPLLYIFMKHADTTSRRVLLGSALVFTLSIGLINFAFPQFKVNLSTDIVTIFLPYTVYFLAGFFLKKINISWTHAVSLFIVYLYIVTFVAIASNGVIGSYFREYNSISIVVMTVIAFIVLIQFNKLTFLSNRPIVQKTLEYVASLVFGAYLIHMMVIAALNKYTKLTPGNIQSPMWAVVLAKTVLVILTAYIIVAIGKKIPYVRYLFA